MRHGDLRLEGFALARGAWTSVAPPVRSDKDGEYYRREWSRRLPRMASERFMEKSRVG